MKNRGIVLKLFLLTASFFVLFIWAVLYFQTSFFEDFYLNDKLEKLTESTREFGQLYARSSWDEKALGQNVDLFGQTNNAQMGIVDENGNLISEKEYSLIIEDGAGRLFKIHLNYLLAEEDYLSRSLRYGDTVRAQGFSWNAPFEDFSPMALWVSGERWFDYTGQLEGAITLDQIEGRIIGYALPSEEELIVGLETQALWAAIDYWFLNEQRELAAGETVDFSFKNPISGVENVALIRPVLTEGKTHYLFVVASQQPIYESIEVLRSYYAYVLVAAILMVLILSLLYSFMISRPLVRINRAAKKMARLDFSENLPVGSQDEIGSLSLSLNTLSRNLQRSLEEQRAANSRLRADIERERESEKQRTAFISAVSHELKTPLGIIQGYAEGIKDGIADHPNDYAEIIIDEVTKIDRLVQDMLELSRIQMETADLEFSSFDLSEMLDEVAGRFGYLMREKDLAFHSEGESPTPVRADRRRMEQVLTNLLSNAIRYSPEGGEIWVSLQESEDRVFLDIENTTSAVPEEKLPRLFDQFYRLDESRNKAQGGTGLGLAIVKDILERHAFDYGVKNTERGLLFYVSLPKRV